MRIKAESHIVWSMKKEIDLGDPSQKKSYIQDVLTNGLAAEFYLGHRRSYDLDLLLVCSGTGRGGQIS